MAIFNTKTIAKPEKGITTTKTYWLGIPIRKDTYHREIIWHDEPKPTEGSLSPYKDKWIFCSGLAGVQQVKDNTEHTKTRFEIMNDKGLLFNTREEAFNALERAIKAIVLKD